MSTEKLTAAEARAHMAQGPQYRVMAGDNCKYHLRGNSLFVSSGTKWYRADEDVFYDSAPFTPYVKATKSQWRERAERAEALVKELEAYASSLVAQRNDYCAQRDACARQKVELLAEMDKIVEDRDGLAHSLGYAEATINVLTAERDAAPGKETP